MMDRKLTDARMEALRKRYPAVEKVLGVFGISTGECGGVLFEDSEGFDGVEVYRKDLLQIAEFMRELAQIAPETGSRAVMASIRPRHTADILSGRKTIEVRKNSPDLPTPFRVYIYETMDRGNGRGKVVGEFVCDEIREERTRTGVSEAFCEEACLTAREILNYAGGGWLYGWHISDLKVYDEPKELGDFTPHCKFMTDDMLSCDHRKVACNHQHFDHNPWPDCSLNAVICKRRMNRPPQSWCYVEEDYKG